MFQLTRMADAINLKTVPRGLVLKLSTDTSLGRFHLGSKELNRASARGANHMVMIATIQTMLISSNAITEFNLGSQTTFGKKFERTVDRGIADRWILHLYQAVQLFGGKVVAGGKKYAEHHISLRTLFESLPSQMLPKNIFGILHLFRGCEYLIVNSVLGHDCGAVPHFNAVSPKRSCLPFSI